MMEPHSRHGEARTVFVSDSVTVYDPENALAYLHAKLDDGAVHVQDWR